MLQGMLLLRLLRLVWAPLLLLRLLEVKYTPCLVDEAAKAADLRSPGLFICHSGKADDESHLADASQSDEALIGSSGQTLSL